MRKDKTTLGIIDAQSVKNAATAEEKGYDGGKKVSGIKRHIVVDTQGLPHAVFITTANVTDRDGAIEMIWFDLNTMSNLSSVKKFLVDGGYSGDNFTDAVKKLLGDHVEVEVVKRDELHKFVVLPQRWVVERTFGWLDHARRLWKNCERWLHNSLQMTILALISALIRDFEQPLTVADFRVKAVKPSLTLNGINYCENLSWRTRRTSLSQINAVIMPKRTYQRNSTKTLNPT